VDHLLSQVNAFIRGDSFFYYHGVVLSVAWLFGAVVAILSRKVSITLHALLFFVIDFLSAFFIVGGMMRVYPYLLEKWNVWPLLKTGHFVGGTPLSTQAASSWSCWSSSTRAESPPCSGGPRTTAITVSSASTSATSDGYWPSSDL
jgi:hypothetical protein